jgi:hypothetical protein
LNAAGQLVRTVELQRAAAEESTIREFFISAIRETAGRNRQEALERLNRALAVDSDPQLQVLRRELGHV